MLTCSCDRDEWDWYYEQPTGVAPLTTKRARRCKSCADRIAVGDDCMEFQRWRFPLWEIERRIRGEDGEVPLPTWYLCDRCSGLFESLDGLGFCQLLDQDLREVAREYANMQRAAGVFRGQMIVNKG